MILSFLILLQGCTLYKSMPVNLDKAFRTKGKVKVVTKSNERLKFKRIDQENGSYYGVKKKKGEIVKISLNKEQIKEVRVKDKTASTILTVIFPIAIIAGGLFIFQDAFKWKSDSLGPIFTY